MTLRRKREPMPSDDQVRISTSEAYSFARYSVWMDLIFLSVPK